MGYATFFKLRCVVAKNLDSDFYNHYRTMFDDFCSSESRKQWDNEAERIITRNGLNKCHWKSNIVDFLFLPDCGGKINAYTCLKIFDLIKNEPDNTRFGYLGQVGNKKFYYTMKDFKNLLRDVYINKGKVVWG